MKAKRRLFNLLITVVSSILFFLIACLVVRLTRLNGYYPSGADTMCHLYKGDLLYREILDGNFYPLFDRLWYNGVEMMRYWAPLPVYFIAACIAISGGSVTEGYLLFIFLICFLGGLSWLYLGFSYRRPVFGAFLGILWFFMPNNLYALYGEGNLPRSLCMVLLPLFVHYVHSYLEEDRLSSLPKLIAVFSLMALCHLGYAGMIALACLIWLSLEAAVNHRKRKCLHVCISILLGFLWIGVWAYASLQGGITSTDSSQVMRGFFQPFLLSVNPFHRLSPGGLTSFYFGLAAFLTALFGLFFSRKKEIPGFGAALIILFCTTSSMYPVLVILPGSQYLWMLRFISIALCLILFSLLIWSSLKKGFLLALCLFLVLDCIPSLKLIINDGSDIPVETRLQELSDETLITFAKSITKQRIALIDESTLGATAPFLISDFGTPMATSFGAGYQSANTAQNIVKLNEAVDLECYPYLFDRCLDLGNDTVLIRVSILKDTRDSLRRLNRAAASVGYNLVKYNDGYRVYHIDTPECFGVKTEYTAIGIGKAAINLALYYPCMEEGSSDCLDDYLFDDLADYRMIYLSGFTYKDRERAEQLVRNLAERGIRIVISAEGIPVDPHTGIRSFLGVSTSDIRFRNGYPELVTTDGVINADYFAPEYRDWQTVYLNGLDTVTGYVEEQGEQLSFLGTAGSDNIVFIGFGLPYHYSLTKDLAVGELLRKTILLEEDRLPRRTIIPLTMEYGRNYLKIVSPKNDVNTTLAFHDNFVFSSSGAKEKNHLLYVLGGETVIRMRCPYLMEGLFTTCIAAFFTLVFFLLLYYLKKSSIIRKAEILGLEPPVEGEPVLFNAKVPEGENYSVSDVSWVDMKRHRVKPGECFGTGSYLLRFRLNAEGRSRFSSGTKVYVGPKEADIFYNRDENRHLSVQLFYMVYVPLRFTEEPEDIRGRINSVLEAKWRMNRPPKTGYLQVFSEGDWEHVQLLEERQESEFYRRFHSDEPSDKRYRVVYLDEKGAMVESREFHVVFD